MDRFLRHEISSEQIELIPGEDWRGNDVKSAFVTDQHETYHRGTWTKWLCLSTLGLCAVLGVVCTALGTTVFDFEETSKTGEAVGATDQNIAPHTWPSVYVSPVTGELLPLLLNAIMTIALDGLGFIHATTLRWALGERLTFNTNLRLFTSSRSCYALAWPVNILYAILLILCYTSTSLLFANRPPPDFCQTHSDLGYGTQGCGNEVHISPPALYCLGVGLLGQAALVTWQHISITVPSWSSNPLDTAWATFNMSQRRVPGRSMMSLHDVGEPTQARYPQARQGSIWKAHREARWIMRYVWLSFGLAMIFFITIEAVIKANLDRVGALCNGCGTYVGPNWNIIPDFGGKGTSTAVIQEQSSQVYPGLFIILFLVTGVVTIALHCAELITVLSRDEKTWRRCASTTPYAARENSAIRAATSWQYIVLFLLKVVLHWISGKGVTYVYNWGIFLRPPQLLYLAIGMGVLAAFTSFLAFKGPSGPQPATFGHVKTLIDLVDEWSLLLYWGDKGLIDGKDEIRHAGTGSGPLQAVVLDALYE